MLITESAGLCNRCSPYLKEIKGVCVIDNLSGINTPKKIGPMLKSADFVVITKGDIVSQAEREVFASCVSSVNPRAVTMHVNGLTGQVPTSWEAFSMMKTRTSSPSRACNFAFPCLPPFAPIVLEKQGSERHFRWETLKKLIWGQIRHDGIKLRPAS